MHCAIIYVDTRVYIHVHVVPMVLHVQCIMYLLMHTPTCTLYMYNVLCMDFISLSCSCTYICTIWFVFVSANT